MDLQIHRVSIMIYVKIYKIHLRNHITKISKNDVGLARKILNRLGDQGETQTENEGNDERDRDKGKKERRGCGRG